MNPAAAKSREAKATKATDATPGASGERRPSGSSAHRALIPPADLGRRPSLILGDSGKLRPGEVLEEKKGRKSSIFAKALEGQINDESTPLREIGEVGPPQFVDMYECYSAVEGETGYISAQVQGIPVPTFKFYYKGVTPLTEGLRYKFHTDGETNTVTLCMRNVKSNDEGKYKIVFSNCHGTVSDETQLYVSKPGVTDFRTLLRKSKYAKWGKDKGDPKWGDLKGVQKAHLLFTSPLVDQTVKEGKDKKVEFLAKFTKQNAKAKWFFRKNELFMGVKYKFRSDGDAYQLTILNPKFADSGKYMIDIEGVQSSASLNVEAPDPSYSFLQPLKKNYNGYTKHELILECKVSDPVAIVSWHKANMKLSSNDKYLINKDLQGVCTLQIKSCELDDAGDFTCQLEMQPDKTETKVKVIDYPYKFVKLLKSQQNIEKDTITFACELDDPLGDVKWFKGATEIKPDGDRIQVITEGRKRKLIIKDAKLSDADQYTCASNADKTKADLLVNKQNKFNKELKDTAGVEREKIVFDIELEDDKAPVEWKLNGKPIKASKRIEIKNLGGGKHQLVINDLKLADAGEITVESGKLKSSCKLTVEKGETKPQFKAPKDIEGSVAAPIVFEVPYKIDGKKQTPIEAFLLKDGKPLATSDVEIQVKDDKVIFTIKKPSRDQSGPYQIKLSNGQGDDVKDVKISVQDVPKAPKDVVVREVFEKTCVIDWKTPTENGGTPIQKYIIERLDASLKGVKWETAGEVPADKPTTFKAEDLTPNKQYKFRVRAVNKVGTSEPAEFQNTIVAKNPWVEPSKPKSLEIVEWDREHAKIKWIKPDNDGGAEITEYEIEVKDKGSKGWVKKKRVTAKETTTTITELIEDQEYEFRVRAVNKAGPGEPSDPIKLFIKPNKFNKQLKDTVATEREKLVLDIEMDDEKAPAEWKFNGKPITPSDRIEIKNLGGGKHQLVINDLKLADAGEISIESGKLKSSCKLSVEKGETKPQVNAPKEVEGSITAPIVFEVPYKIDGKKQTPIQASLLKDGKPLPSDNVGVEVKDDKVIFTIKKPSRDQSGPYQIKLSNGQGDDVKDVKISVQDVPNAPKDVVVREVFEKTCVIDWKTPTENGGTPIQKYIIERLDASSKGVKWETAGEVPADKPTTFKVEDLTPNKQYKFRIRAVNKVGTSEPAEFQNTVLAKNPWDEPSKPKSLEVVEWNRKQATIKWLKPDNDGGAEITEYEIEVKSKGSKDWVKKKRVSAKETTTTITELVEDQEYEFRVRAVNKAGPGEPSDSTKLFIKPNKFNKPLKDTVAVERENLVLDIEMDDDKAEAEWKFNGKPITPSDRIEIKNLGGGKHQLVIKDLKVADAGELSVESGKLKSSCKLTVEKGETKPQINAPNVVEGSITAPIVFEVPYTIDGKKQTPIQASLLKDGKPLAPGDVEIQVKDDKVVFTIKKPTRDQSGPYQIKLSNGQGDDVKDVKISVQDVPNAPKDVVVREVFEKTCVIDWKTPTENGGTPIQKYVVERQDVSSKGAKWETAGEVPADKPTTFKIEDLTPNKQYKVRVRAINKVGTGEPAEFQNAILAKNPWDEPSKPKSLEIVEWDRAHAKVKWLKPDNDGGAEITEYEIEVKDKDSKDWKKKRVPASETTAEITDLKEGQEYEFRVRAVNKAGPGEPSDSTKLFVKPNKFNTPLKDTVAVERDNLVLDIEMDDEKAPAEWKINGKPVKPSDRIEIKNLGGGKHQLVIKDLKVADAGEIAVESGKLKSSCKLTVQKGETKPQINAPQVVEGSITAPIVFEVPYTIDGKKQTPIGASLLKDGKPLPSDNVDIQVKDDKVIFTIKKPTRDQSGPYQIKLSNGQGDDVKDINISVQDVPNAPEDVNVRDIFEKSCVINWKSPKENGGTPIQKYIIEHQDVSSKGKWETAGEVPADKPTTFIVESLTPNKEYKLRIRAVNKVGTSEPTEFKNTILAKNPWDEPSKPKSLEITDWDKDHVKLKWVKPDKDGGAEITEYEIEVKDKQSKEWVKKKRVSATETATTVSELIEGHEYEFRVRAVNKAGPGEPSDATKPMVVKSRFVKPFITGDKLKKIVIKKGEQVKYEIRYGGEPEPEVKWEKDAKILTSDNRIKIEKSAGTTILTIQNAVRSDSGKYKLILTNGTGTIDSTGEVIVLDKPSAPKGPLEVFDIIEDGCKLKWNKSDDNGGIEILEYKIEIFNKTTNNWSLLTKISGDKTKYTVTDLTYGPEYKFRVSAINKEGESESLVTENWTMTRKAETEIVEYKSDTGAEVGVSTCTTERRAQSGDVETTTKTTVTTTTTKNQIQDGNITRTETRTVKKIVTHTTEEEEFEEYYEEDEDEVEE
ncbi:twitchin-like isoform X2 [Bradysia coprophila]|uniref:twitchin-like isoform X2 n=1 Tax=Bradysia coprophila TaxID=38358 RepID=UPI00187DC59C|nr:twitchin-like isoform X2 [Bradysia coprophila]